MSVGKLISFFLLLLALGSSSLAQGAEEPTEPSPESSPVAEVPSSRKSPETAAILGGVVGFGTGHYYAYDHWTLPSTIFAVTDTLTAGITVALFQLQSGWNNTSLGGGFVRTFGVALWATAFLTSRYYEMTSARSVLQPVQEPAQPEDLIDEARESRLEPIVIVLPLAQIRF